MWKVNSCIRFANHCITRRSGLDKTVSIILKRNLSNKDVIAMCGGSDKVFKVSNLRQVSHLKINFFDSYLEISHLQ